MNKKLIAVLALVLVVSTTSVFAIGIGVQGGYTVNGVAGGALTFKPDGSDLIFAINADFWGYGVDIGGTADYWVANKTLAKPVNYYYGVGAGAGVNIWGNTLTATVAGRVFIGLNLFTLDNFLEVYLQGAWQPGIAIGIGNEGGVHPMLATFPINAGIRFWF